MNSGGKSRGCFFYGCLTAILIVIGLIVGTFFGTRYAVKKLVATYTDTQPVAVPSLNISEAETQRRLARYENEFKRAARGGQSVRLDSTDVNLLLRQDPSLKPFSDKIYIAVTTNDLLRTTVSLPLDDFEAWRKASRRLMSSDLKGRYLNADVLMLPTMTNGQLHFILKDVQVRGQSMPGEFTGKLQLDQAAQSINTNAQSRAILDRIDSISLTNGQVELHLKKP